MLNLNKCMINNFLKETKEKSFILKQTLLYMKVFIFIFLASLQFVSANTSAQTISFNVNNAKLEDVFKTIASQSHYKFLYNDEVLAKKPRVTINVHNASLDEVLKRLLSDEVYEYKIMANTVLISTAPQKFSTPAVVQTKASGVVVDENGKVLSNVSVIVVGSSIASMTDKEGRFQLQANVGNILEARYVGYKTTRLTITTLNNIRLVLNSEEASIEEVQVVATGYQNLDRKLFTGASTRVNAKDAERSGVPDISRMLEGQAAGVSVQNVSGTFGAAPKIRVRGATSLSGDNKPLWVVDGIVLDDVVNISNEALSTGDANTLIGSSVAGLNPDDIESFTILKDAAATALYGARAMNGVIVVNTKKGRNTEGKPVVNYSGTLTTYLKPNYNQFDIMNSAEQMSVMMEMENKGFFNHSDVSRASTGGIFYKMYNMMYDYDQDSETFALKNTKEARLAFLQRYASANTDWFDLLFKNSLLQEHSVNISGGTEKSQTFFSTSFMNDSGQTLGDRVKRYTANFRNNFKINEKLSAEFLVNGSIRDQYSPGTLTRQSDPVYGAYSRDFDINPYSYALNTSRLITPYNEDGSLEYFTRNYAGFNIINELQKNYMNLNMLDLKVQSSLDYKLLSGLTYKVSGAYRYANTDRKHYVMEGANMAEAFRAASDETIIAGNTFLYNDPDNPNAPKYIVLPAGGFLNTNLNNLKSYYFRNDLTYDFKLRDLNHFNFFGSMEVRYTDRQNTDYEGIGYQYENNGLVDPNFRYFKKMSEGGDPYFGMRYGKERYVGVALRGAYSFDEKYVLNGTFRYDGSNQMGKSKDARWLPTWNMSGKWNLDREDFFNQESTLLSAAAIRATYGMTGSLNPSANSGVVYSSQITYRPWDNEKESMIYISNNQNINLTWEKMYELNVGVDLSFFNSKIDLTMDWYQRNGFDLIGLIRTSGVEGEYNKLSNYADLKARGFEFTIAGSPIKNTSGVKWSRTQFNFAYNTNKVENLKVNPNIWSSVRAEGAAVEGYAQRGLFSLQFDGLDPEYGYPTFIGTTGNKDAYIYLQSEDIDYLKYHGPTDPTFTGGFYNSFSYNNFDLSFLFTFAAGNYIRLQPTFSSAYNDMTAMSKDIVNRWLMPGDEKLTNVPAILDPLTNSSLIIDADGEVRNGRYPYNAYNYSDQRVVHGNFIRFKNLSLSYNLPSTFAKKMGLSSLRMSLVGNNLALLYSDKKLNGADPEFFNNGGVAMPVPKQYTFSLKAGF